MPDNHYLVPNQLQGFEKNISQRIVMQFIDDAEDRFVGAKEKMLDVASWCKYYNATGFDLILTDSHGKTLHRRAHKGDHIRIYVNGSVQTSGSDWMVQALEYDDYPDEDKEAFAMRIVPVDADKNDRPAANNDHSATLVIERVRKNLEASFHSRNEATLALGLSDEQWQSLVKGWVG